MPVVWDSCFDDTQPTYDSTENKWIPNPACSGSGLNSGRPARHTAAIWCRRWGRSLVCHVGHYERADGHELGG